MEAKLNSLVRALEARNFRAGCGIQHAVVNQLEALVKTGRLDPTVTPPFLRRGPGRRSTDQGPPGQVSSKRSSVSVATPAAGSRCPWRRKSRKSLIARPTDPRKNIWRVPFHRHTLCAPEFARPPSDSPLALGSSMIVTALGHAGFKVATTNATLLLDPWFSPEGAFQGSWFQYPDNSHLLADEELFRPTAILISHEHLDHVDPWFLSRVPPDVPVIVPRYPSPALREKIGQGGPRQVIELDQWEWYDVAPDTRVFFVSEPPMNHDSAMVIAGDGHTFLNMNDARLFPVQLREIRQTVGGTIDVFAFQAAGASWYPMCYDYPEAHRRELSRKKRLAKFAYCMKSMRVVEPVVGLPVAGPPAFLDPELFAHNREMEEGIFPDQRQAADWLQAKGVENTDVLLPGDAWDGSTRRKRPDPHWYDFSFEQRERYLVEYQARRLPALEAVLRRYPEPEGSLWEPFREYFSALLSMSPYFNERIGMRVGFDVTGRGGGAWHVDFRTGREGIGEGLEECGYVYRFESRWLPPILNGSTPWEDFFLTLRFEARRDPDVYNDHLLGLLKFAEVEALEEVERFETAAKSDERFTVHSGGKIWSVSRYCPHAGNDLLHTGEVLPGGVLRCLAHHYDFDLESGRCLTGNCAAIQTEVVGAIDHDAIAARAADGTARHHPPGEGTTD